MSDNGTTFTAAARHLNNLCESSVVRDSTSDKSNGKFTPTRAPWFWDWWEKKIGLNKNVLKKVLGKAYVTYETLQTIVTEAEAVIKDRHLTYVTSGEPGQPETLTPAHLLYGRPITSLPVEPATLPADYRINRSSRLKQGTRRVQLIQNFHERWRREYLTALRERSQVRGNNNQTISVGDVVQIQDDCPRTQWRLAAY
ncbi:uncharacterized protein LOC127866183 [Dreissena polymorpha]|uniref:uncharacterized protein LOC127866183 n=1 Tax=Dreissena polymorpha TaxID=45954 RepID=UPI0022652DF5|nr:uncharacterized protein LOC127866183 [Dreissena polymorpha]